MLLLTASPPSKPGTGRTAVHKKKKAYKEENKARAFLIMWFLSAVEWVPVRLAEVDDVRLRWVWIEMLDDSRA